MLSCRDSGGWAMQHVTTYGGCRIIDLPAAAGADALTDGRTLLDVLIAFVVFCLAASSIYLVNDARDVEADRAHPTKRFRPIASGMLPINLAYGMAVLLIVLAIAALAGQ